MGAEAKEDVEEQGWAGGRKVVERRLLAPGPLYIPEQSPIPAPSQHVHSLSGLLTPWESVHALKKITMVSRTSVVTSSSDVNVDPDCVYTFPMYRGDISGFLVKRPQNTYKNIIP